MYSSDTCATALGISQKAFDNFVARGAKSLLPPGRQGRSRQIDGKSLEILTLAMLLCRDLQMPSVRAVEFAERIVRSPEGVPVGTLGVLRFDVEKLRSVLQAAVADAIDGNGPRRRGRPQAASMKNGAPLVGAPRSVQRGEIGIRMPRRSS